MKCFTHNLLSKKIFEIQIKNSKLNTQNYFLSHGGGAFAPPGAAPAAGAAPPAAGAAGFAATGAAAGFGAGGALAGVALPFPLVETPLI
jgi:hypothetical protein